MKLKEYFDTREDILKRCLRNEKYFLYCLRDGKRLKELTPKRNPILPILLVALDGNLHILLFYILEEDFFRFSVFALKPSNLIEPNDTI